MVGADFKVPRLAPLIRHAGYNGGLEALLFFLFFIFAPQLQDLSVV